MEKCIESCTSYIELNVWYFKKTNTNYGWSFVPQNDNFIRFKFHKFIGLFRKFVEFLIPCLTIRCTGSESILDVSYSNFMRVITTSTLLTEGLIEYDISKGTVSTIFRKISRWIFQTILRGYSSIIQLREKAVRRASFYSSAVMNIPHSSLA